MVKECGALVVVLFISFPVPKVHTSIVRDASIRLYLPVRYPPWLWAETGETTAMTYRDEKRKHLRDHGHLYKAEIVFY